MNRGNRAFNARAIERLDVQPGARVLDLGFGGGLTFRPLLERGATVVGVDRAQDMVEAARARHRAEVDAGRLSLHAGEVQALPLEDAAVDRILTVNTVYFWPDLAPAFAELHRVLAPGGRVVIGIRDGSVMEKVDRAVFTLRTPQEIAAALGGRVRRRGGPLRAGRQDAPHRRDPPRLAACLSGASARSWRRPRTPCAACRRGPRAPHRSARSDPRRRTSRRTTG